METHFADTAEYQSLVEQATALADERDRLRSLNAELVKALEPFAAIFKQKNPPDVDYYMRTNTDHAWGFNDWILHWSDLVNARAALSRSKDAPRG